MDAIGLIETQGLIPAIEACDIMLKTSQVELVDRSLVGSGIVTITVTGDVGAVKAAVDAGASAVQHFGSQKLLSQHVIPRPSELVSEIIFQETKEEPALEMKSAEKAEKAEEAEEIVLDLEKLKQLTVKELRLLAKKYDNLGLADNKLNIANRATLLKRFEALIDD